MHWLNNYIDTNKRSPTSHPKTDVSFINVFVLIISRSIIPTERTSNKNKERLSNFCPHSHSANALYYNGLLIGITNIKEETVALYFNIYLQHFCLQ